MSTAHTLVMAVPMIPGSKVDSLIGRHRGFAIGCVVYGCGSLITAIARCFCRAGRFLKESARP